MDRISDAINRGYHISNDEELNKQEWEAFEQAAVNRRVFLFGAGAGAVFFWDKYEDSIAIEGVIDNQDEKQGLVMDEAIADAYGHFNMKVKSCAELEKYKPEEVVILITSLKYYQEIIEQLKQLGFCNYYVLMIMEANRRAKGTSNFYTKTWLERRKACARVYSEFPICPKKIVFWTFSTYSDHGKYIAEQLLRIRRDIDIVWLVKDTQIEVPEGIRLVDEKNWKAYIYEMETAQMWIFNAEIPMYIIKRPGQIFIETKHWASITLKRIYLDAPAITDISEDVERWKYSARCMDYLITGSDFDTESCRRGFDFHKDVLQIGSPRTDAMFRRKEMKERVCNYYQIDKECKLLVYAPTFRYKKNEEKHVQEIRNIDLEYDKLKCTLEQKFGGIWRIILRLHPGHEKEMENLERPEYVLDGTNYCDGQELAAACDILITDYSSIMFEPAFVKKPVFLFATDREDYIDKEYNVLIEYNTLPFPIAENNEELLGNIENFDKKEYEKTVDDFLKKYHVHEDGHASERAAEFISKLLDA